MGKNAKSGSVLVVGGGIAGIQASLDLADSGYKVYLVEKKSSIGGHMAQFDKTFPTNDCAMCTLSPKLVECGTHPNVEILTLSEVDNIKGEAGNFNVTVNRKARYVDTGKCTGCGECVQNCPVKYEIYKQPSREIQYHVEPADQKKINDIIEQFGTTPGALMLVLQAINHEFGYLGKDVLRYTAQKMNVPLSLIYRIVTFYSAFSLVPRGRHTISVCIGTTCYVRGAEKIMDLLTENLRIQPGETTDDLRFSLETVRCLGCCSLAPVLTVDGETHGKVKPSNVTELLTDYE